MSLLDEQIIEEWLNRQKFFTMRGVKIGQSEMDILAVRPSANGELECWHVECQISFNPIGYIGGDSNAKLRSPEEIAKGVKDYVDKKFLQDNKLDFLKSLFNGHSWQKVFVYANLKDSSEIAEFEKFGLKMIRYTTVIDELCAENVYKSSSVATNIVDLFKYYREKKSSQ